MSCCDGGRHFLVAPDHGQQARIGLTQCLSSALPRGGWRSGAALRGPRPPSPSTRLCSDPYGQQGSHLHGCIHQVRQVRYENPRFPKAGRVRRGLVLQGPEACVKVS